MKKPIVFIPAYKCENQIGRVIEQVKRSEDKISELIVVENRSPDGTLEKAISMCSDLSIPYTIFRNDENYNLGGSHKVAFEYARSQKSDLIVLHGDDQANLDDFWPHQSLSNRYECLLGSRFTDGSKLSGYSLIRTYGNKVFNVLFSITGKKKITDLGSGLNFYTLKFLERRLEANCPDSLSFNYRLLLNTCQQEIPFTFFPISWREEDQRSNVAMVSQAKGMLKMLMNYKKDPEKFFNEGREEGLLKKYPTTAMASKNHTESVE